MKEYLANFFDFILKVAGISNNTFAPSDVSLRLHTTHFTIFVHNFFHFLVQHVGASIDGTKPTVKQTILVQLKAKNASV